MNLSFLMIGIFIGIMIQKYIIPIVDSFIELICLKIEDKKSVIAYDLNAIGKQIKDLELEDEIKNKYGFRIKGDRNAN